MLSTILAIYFGLWFGAAFYVVASNIGDIVSWQRVGGMRFVRFGPISVSFCLTAKPVRKVVQ